MNVAEYTKALSKLPINFKVIPHQELCVCEWANLLIATAKHYPPIYYKNGEWQEIEMASVA